MRRSSQSLRALILIILVSISIIWISLIIWDSKGQVLASLPTFASMRLGLALLSGMAAVFAASYVYSLMLFRINPNLSAIQAMTSFAVSQIVRYLPGRIWGVVYQTQSSAGYVPARDTVKANIENYVVVNLNTVAIAASVFTHYKMGAMAALPVFFSSIMAVFFILRSSVFHKIAIAVEGRILGSISLFRGSSLGNDLLIIVVLQVEWLFYFLASSFILPAHFNVTDVVIVATCYSMASMVSAFAFVLPGGILLREALFLWLSDLLGYNPVDMLAFSIIARFIHTLADIAFALFGLMVQKASVGEKALLEREGDLVE